MKQFFKKLFIIMYVLVLVIVSFEPYMSKADSSIQYKETLEYNGISVLNTSQIGDEKYPGIIFSGQRNFPNSNDSYIYSLGDYAVVYASNFYKSDHYGYNQSSSRNNSNTTGEFGTSGDVEVKKVVTATNKTQSDGIYAVDFYARAKGYTTPTAYVVIVLDNSNSMAPEQKSQGTCKEYHDGRCYDKFNNAISGAKLLAQEIVKLPGAQVSLVSFAGGTSEYVINATAKTETTCGEYETTYTCPDPEYSYPYTETELSGDNACVRHTGIRYDVTRIQYDYLNGKGYNCSSSNGKYYCYASFSGKTKEVQTCKPGTEVTNTTYTYESGSEKKDVAWNDARIVRGWSHDSLDTLNDHNGGPIIYRPDDEQNGNVGGTNLQAGMIEAETLLNQIDDPNALKYVVVMTDGEPTFYYESDGKTAGSGKSYESQGFNNANTIAARIKNTGEIFTIAYDSKNNNNVKNVLDSISSDANERTEKHKYDASKDNITDIMQGIGRTIADLSSLNVSDGLGIPFGGLNVEGNTTEFKLVGDNKYSAQINNSVILTEDWQTIGRFYIQMDPDSPTGWYPTNDGYSFTYFDPNSSTKQGTIYCSDNPEVWWEQKNNHEYTVEYYYEDENGTETFDNIKYLIDENLTEHVVGTKENPVHLNDPFSASQSIIDDENHLKSGFEFVNVRYSDNSLITNNDGVYQKLVVKDDTKNVIKVYYRKVFTLSVEKVLKDITTDSVITNSNNKFSFKIKVKNLDSTNRSKDYYYYDYNKATKEYNRVDFEFNNSNEYTFEIKANHIAIFQNIPRNYEYVITETNTTGYIVEYNSITSNKDGINGYSDKLNKNQEVIFTNITGYELPETGSTGGLIMTITSLFLIGMPVIYIAYNFYIDSKERISWRSL